MTSLSAELLGCVYTGAKEAFSIGYVRVKNDNMKILYDFLRGMIDLKQDVSFPFKMATSMVKEGIWLVKCEKLFDTVFLKFCKGGMYVSVHISNESDVAECFIVP